jgi:hypothetical protein
VVAKKLKKPRNVMVGGKAHQLPVAEGPPGTGKKTAVGLIIGGGIVSIGSAILFALAFGVLASVIVNPFFLLIPLVIGVAVVIGGAVLYRSEPLNASMEMEKELLKSTVPHLPIQNLTNSTGQSILLVPAAPKEHKLPDDIEAKLRKICARLGKDEKAYFDQLSVALVDALNGTNEGSTEYRRIQNILQGVENDSHDRPDMSAICKLCGVDETKIVSHSNLGLSND